MNNVRWGLWIVGGLWGAASVIGCGSEPSCEDLANCAFPTGSSTSSSSGSSGQTSSSGGSSGTIGGPENCTNGLDDDNDGNIDCADAECSDKYICLPPIPAGFTEVITIAVTPYGEQTAACADGTAPKLFYQNPAVDACDACTCDASGVTCTPGQLATGTGMTCTNAKPVGPVVPGQCKQASGGSAMLVSAVTTNGSCVANSATAPLEPPMETTIAACSVGGTAGGGCGMSGTCVPGEGVAMAEHLCIKRPGHEVCPGDWPLAVYVFESFVDDRSGCTPCGCSASCDGGQYMIFPSNMTACASGGLVVDTVGACVPSGGSIFGSRVTMSPLVPSCTTTGGVMMGSVQPMTETTFCCY